MAPGPVLQECSTPNPKKTQNPAGFESGSVATSVANQGLHSDTTRPASRFPTRFAVKFHRSFENRWKFPSFLWETPRGLALERRSSAVAWRREQNPWLLLIAAKFRFIECQKILLITHRSSVKVPDSVACLVLPATLGHVLRTEAWFHPLPFPFLYITLLPRVITSRTRAPASVLSLAPTRALSPLWCHKLTRVPKTKETGDEQYKMTFDLAL